MYWSPATFKKSSADTSGWEFAIGLSDDVEAFVKRAIKAKRYVVALVTRMVERPHALELRSYVGESVAARACAPRLAAWTAATISARRPLHGRKRSRA